VSTYQLGVLRCKNSGTTKSRDALAIVLAKIGHDQYERIFPLHLMDCNIPDEEWWMTQPRTLVYVKQVDSREGGFPRRFIRWKIPKQIHFKSLQALNVVERLHGGDITRWESQVYKPPQPLDRIYLQLDGSAAGYPQESRDLAGIVLQADDEETFGLVFFAFQGHIGVKVVVPEEGCSFIRATRHMISNELEKWRGLDRVSALLKSGKAVSVVLRTTNSLGRGKFHSELSYTADVTVNMDGRLRWTDPDRMLEIK